jgi:uncharacterized protein
MEAFMEWIRQPWPWYVAGPLIGLTVPLLLIIGNKTFGISSSLRHICAACLPANIQFFKYDWKRESWNLVFVGGILLGGILTVLFLSNPNEMQVAEATMTDLRAMGIQGSGSLMPTDIFSFENVFTLKGLIFFVLGGFLVGFGTRYAGGCTSGHTIMGLSNLQWPSLIATIFFMVGGFFMAWIGLPMIMTLLN